MENAGLLFITSAAQETDNWKPQSHCITHFFLPAQKCWSASLNSPQLFVIMSHWFVRVFPTQLSQIIVNVGGIAAVIDYLGESKGAVRLPGIMMLGYVAAHTENLAMAVIVSKVC